MGKIVIGVDHKWRDLPGYVYAKLLLEKLGHEVQLVRNGFEEGCACFHKADLIIYNHVYEDKRAKSIAKLSSFGMLNVLMPTEGIPTLSNTQIFATGKFSDLSNVDVHFVWNSEMKRLMMEHTDFNPEKILITGVPRFDFYKPPLNATLMSKTQFKEKYGINNNYPIVTLATNFTNAGFYKHNEEFLRSDWKKLKVDQVLDPQECARRDYESREIIMAGIEELLKRFPEINLIIKLHPSENHAYFYELLRGPLLPFGERVRIIVQEYIWDVLHVTDVLLKRSCTTGVEAWMMGKPTVEVRLNPDEWYCSEEHAGGSDIIASVDELAQKVDYYLAGGVVPDCLVQKRQEFLEKWCYRIDGKSTERFVGIVDKMVKAKGSASEISYDWSTLKQMAIYGVLRMTDYKIHDLRVYGWDAKEDKLGRVDKYIHDADADYWYTKIRNAVKNMGDR